MAHPLKLSQAEILKAREDNPKLRARDLAEHIGISEAELVAASLGQGVTRLKDTVEDILLEIEKLGDVMALTRNESCVHERRGVYSNCSFETHGRMRVGLFVNEDIDLRLFMSHWASAFSVSEDKGERMLHSIQFFDKAGTALHKIYLTENSNIEAFHALTDKFKAEHQSPELLIAQDNIKPEVLADLEVDWKSFRKDWENLQDTHDFYPMLRKHKVDRLQAFRNIGEDFAFQVTLDSPALTLESARDTQTPIMVFVGNKGCIQIHTGEVFELKRMGPWYNVLDSRFNLHLREDKVSEVWVTRKPTIDGDVNALEIFDSQGELVATFFGKRKPGLPELEAWRSVLSTLPKLGA